MSEQWTDERIIAEAEAIVADYPFDHAMRRHTIGTMTQIRNDMQSQIARLQTVVIERNETIDEMNRIAELAKDTHTLTEALKQQQQIANEYRRLLGQSNAQNDALRQQLAEAQQQAKTQAGQWQPVEDGAFCHDIIDGFSALEVEGGQIVSIRHVSNLGGEAVQLIHDMGDLRFCRRIAWPKEEARRVNELSA